MKILTRPPRAETVVVNYLTAALLARGQLATCGVNIPPTWTAGATPHVQVALDGTPVVEYPIIWRASVRITAWATATTVAQDLAGLCEALMLSHPGGGGVASVQSLTGVLPTRDPDTNAQLASLTVRVNLRGVPLA